MAISDLARRRLSFALGNWVHGDEVSDVLDAAQPISTAEMAVIDGVTAGTVTASKAIVVDSDQEIDILMVTVVDLTADDSSSATNQIPAGATNVTVSGVTNDANDYIELPAIADVPIGHTINIACNASSNFELRTVASSGTTINNVDSDGTQEYLCTDTDLIRVTKLLATGYVAQSITYLGAVRTAVVPD